MLQHFPSFCFVGSIDVTLRSRLLLLAFSRHIVEKIHKYLYH